MELIFKEIDSNKIINEQNNEIIEIHKNISDLVEIGNILNTNISSQFHNINLSEQTSLDSLDTVDSNNINKVIDNILTDTKNIKENKSKSNFFIILMLSGLAIGMPLGFIITTTATGALVGLSTGGILGTSIGYFIDSNSNSLEGYKKNN